MGIWVAGMGKVLIRAPLLGAQAGTTAQPATHVAQKVCGNLICGLEHVPGRQSSLLIHTWGSLHSKRSGFEHS